MLLTKRVFAMKIKQNCSYSNEIFLSCEKTEEGLSKIKHIGIQFPKTLCNYCAKVTVKKVNGKKQGEFVFCPSASFEGNSSFSVNEAGVFEADVESLGLESVVIKGERPYPDTTDKSAILDVVYLEQEEVDD